MGVGGGKGRVISVVLRLLLLVLVLMLFVLSSIHSCAFHGCHHTCTHRELLGTCKK